MIHQTLPELFFAACEKFDKENAVLVKQNGQFHPYSHKFFRQRVDHFARGLMALGLEAGSAFAIFSETRFEWVIADMAILSAGCISVPVYPSVPEDQLEFILNDANVKGIVVSSKDLLEKIRTAKPAVPKLKSIICMESGELPSEVHGFHQVEIMGSEQDNQKAFEARMKGIRSEDIFTYVYTSGTTGMPKGVMLTHANMLANIAGVESAVPFRPEDTCLSHLPLSHVLERMAGYYLMIYCGVSIAYAESMKTVAEDLMLVRPTVMISVPRLFEKIYAKVMDNFRSSGFLKRKFINWAVDLACTAAPTLGRRKALTGLFATKYNLADKVVFAKIREKTGGRLRYLISGGAPLPKEIGTFFLGIGIRILEGYGLTETAPVLCVNRPDLIKVGTVGPAIENVEIRIAEDGEILAKGPNIMKGYHNNPEATAEVFENGWFKTGDIGELDSDGYLRITDRKKEILVTSGGKNIAPQPIENSLKVSDYIEQVVLIGDRHNYITALIVPPWETVQVWGPALGCSTDPEKVCKDAKFHAVLEADIKQRLKDFARYEQVKKFTVLPHFLTEEGGELTPSLKLKRRIISQKYAAQIEAMYAEGAD